MFRHLHRIHNNIGRLFLHDPKPHLLTLTPFYHTTTATCRAQRPSIDTANIKEERSAKPEHSRSSPKLRKNADKKIPLKRLHHRVLSDQEVSQNEEMARVVSDLPSDERFGAYSGQVNKDHPKKSPVKPPRNRARQMSPKKGTLDEGDVFGTMVEEDELELPSDIGTENRVEESNEEGDSDDEHIPLTEYGLKGNNARWYAKQIEQLGKEKKVYEAVHMLEETMIKEDRVAPNEYVFTVVIGILGRVGYTKKAFKLFNKMKKYGLIPEDPTYTALFNACANSPWTEDGLRRANNLCVLMREKGVEPNPLTIKAMVKAYAKLGEIQTAFSIIDRMVEAGHKLDEQAWSHLLMACISDKDTGLKHAIEVWRRMRRKIKPNVHHYNLLLRAARDCGVGDTEYANQLIGGSTSLGDPPEQGMEHQYQNNDNPRLSALGISSERSSARKRQIAMTSVGDGVPNDCEDTETINEDTVAVVEKVDSSKSALAAIDKANLLVDPSILVSIKGDGAIGGLSMVDMAVPNILNPRGIRRHQIVTLGDLETPESRLALLGGVAGVLSLMRRDKAVPDIRTFSQMLGMIPSSGEAEGDLLAAMKEHRVSPDADLLNALIQRRCKSGHLEAAKEVLDLFGRYRKEPNIMTFASLALGCKKYSDGFQLLRDIKAAGMKPTVDIFSILMVRASFDFRYIKALCGIMQREAVTPNTHILNVLEERVQKTRKALVQKEKGREVDRCFQRPELPETFKEFMLFYKPWLTKMELDIPAHPWSQFRRPSPESNPDS